MSFINLGEKEFNLVIDNISIEEFSIVVGVDRVSKGPIVAPANVLKAVEQMKKYISLITGIGLSVTTDKNPIIKKYEICIGNTDRNKEKTNFHEDEYEIKVMNGRLFIIGGKRGIIYGVYTFLEKYCGVRFFTEDIEKIIDADKIVIPNNIYDRYCPPFEYRDLCFWNAFSTEFSVKRKINGLFVRDIPESWGGGIGWAGGPSGLVHTFMGLVPYEEYFSEHPEYYALSEDGKREPLGLCLSEEGTYLAALKTAKDRLKKSNTSDILSISINDGGMVYCNCPRCKRIKEIEGGETGLLLRFVNRMAEELKPEFPDVKVETLIYGNINEVPKITVPRDDVIIRICGALVRSHSYSDYGVSKNYSKEGQVIRACKRIEEWSKVAKKIYYWDYPAPYVIINSIFPHFHTLRKNAEYFVKHNVKGVFINGNTITAQFSYLTVYLISKLAFEPDMTEDDFNNCLNEFLEGYYGKGWHHIKEFIEYTRMLGTKDDRVFTSHDTPDTIFGGLLGEAELLKMHNYFESAYNESERNSEKYRIKMDSLQVDYFDIYSLSERKYKESSEEKKKELCENNRKLYQDLVKYGILRVGENCFLPVVKDFRQAPLHWSYWDYEQNNGDRNNANFSRDIYHIITCDYPLGTKVNVKFKFKTNNNNCNSFGSFYGSAGYNYIMKNGKKESLIYDNYSEFKELSVTEAIVINRKEYADFDKHKEEYSGYEFIMPHQKGVIFKMENIDAGAYFFFRDVEIKEVI